MSPELVSELKARIAELEPKERAAWAECERIDAEYKPKDEAARNFWVPLHRELTSLRLLLAKECAEQCAKGI